MINILVTEGLHSDNIIDRYVATNRLDVFKVIYNYLDSINFTSYYYRLIYFDDCITMDFGSHHLFIDITFDTDEEKNAFLKEEGV